jgi:uncharacterized protein YdaU (DUF1376 family)
MAKPQIKKEEWIRIRCTEEYKAEVEKLATEAELSVSDYIRQLIKKDREKRR